MMTFDFVNAFSIRKNPQGWKKPRTHANHGSIAFFSTFLSNHCLIRFYFFSKRASSFATHSILRYIWVLKHDCTVCIKCVVLCCQSLRFLQKVTDALCSIWFDSIHCFFFVSFNAIIFIWFGWFVAIFSVWLPFIWIWNVLFC